MSIEREAATLAEFVKASRKATPGPWASPGANVFRLFAWKDCGEEGMKPRRCIISDAMPTVYFGRDEFRWPESDKAGEEACANIQMIAQSRAVPDAIVAVLLEAEMHILRAKMAWGDDEQVEAAGSLLAAIRSILTAVEKKEDGA